MNHKPILAAIKERLLLGGELPQAQRHYLIEAFSRHDNGEPLDMAFANAALPVVKRGKESPAYREAKRLRNERLRRALELMPGPSDWKKCEQLAALASRVYRRHKTGGYRPESEAERVLVQIIEAGTRAPITPRGFHTAIYRKIKPD